MHDLVDRTLARLDANHLDGFPAFVYPPDYNGYSIANIPASLCTWLGATGLATALPPLAPELLGHWGRTFRDVILLVVDGVGLNVMLGVLEEAGSNADLRAWRELPQDSLLAALTSVTPSTTASALCTLWTGAPPAAHGVIGYEVFLKEYSLIANMLTHNPASFTAGSDQLRGAGFNAQAFLPLPVLGPHLAGQGIQTYAFIHRSIAQSGLSSMLYQAAITQPVHSPADLFANLNDLLESPSDQPRYINAYWGSLDDMAHRYGPGDERVRREMAAFSLHFGYFLADRRRHGRGDTLLVLTADHGHILTPKEADYELRNHPRLLDTMVMLPSGEARLPYVFLRPGREATFLDYVAKTWGGRFTPMPAEQFLASGVMGDGARHPDLPNRIGDCVVIVEEGAYWYFPPKENPLLGRHGGLSRTEMLVPLLGMVL